VKLWWGLFSPGAWRRNHELMIVKYLCADGCVAFFVDNKRPIAVFCSKVRVTAVLIPVFCHPELFQVTCRAVVN
jgi:hypothetical protein